MGLSLGGVLGGAIGGTSLFGTALSFGSTALQNYNERRMAQSAEQFSGAEAEKARIFSAEQAAIDRKFQQQMSDTAETRRVQDLKNAGLNPMLSVAGIGSASTPGGAMPQSAQGQAYKAGSSDYAVSAATVAKLLADAEASSAVAAKTRAETPAAGQYVQSLQSQIDLNNEQQKFLNYQVGKVVAEQQLSAAQTAKVMEEVKNVIIERGVINASALSEAARAILLKLSIPEAQNMSDAQASWWKQNISPYLQEILGIGKAVGTGAVGGALLRTPQKSDK